MSADPVRIAVEVLREHRWSPDPRRWRALPCSCGIDAEGEHAEYIEHVTALLVSALTAADALMPDEAKALRDEKAALIAETRAVWQAHGHDYTCACVLSPGEEPCTCWLGGIGRILARHGGTQT